jgi:hypothetical protein
MKIELKKIKFYEDMSKETFCFTAQIYINGKNSGTASNDGRGGCIEYHPHPGFNELFRKAELFLSEQPNIVYPKEEFCNELSVKCNFENWINLQIYNFDKEEVKKKLKKDMLKGICYGNERAYTVIWWENYSLDMLLTTPVGKLLLQSKVNELKAKGKKILNTNLVGIKL